FFGAKGMSGNLRSRCWQVCEPSSRLRKERRLSSTRNERLRRRCMKAKYLAVCIWAIALGRVQAQEPKKPSTKAPATKQQFSLDQLKSIELLPGREAIQNPQAAELWHMKEKADRLNSSAETQDAKDAIHRLANKFARQFQIAVNLPANTKITNGRPAMPGQI